MTEMRRQPDVVGLSRRGALLSGATLGGATLLSTMSPAMANSNRLYAATRSPGFTRVRRVSFRNSRGGTIVGNLRRGRGDAIVLMAHGWQGNKSSRGRFDYLSEVFSNAGYATLAIDFSGCGESSDDIISMAHGTDDLKSAIAFVRNHGYTRAALYGNSWGTQICVRAFDPGVEALVLSGALTDAMHYTWSDYYSATELEQLQTTGVMTVADPEPIWRSTQQLSRESLDDYANIQQQPTLSAISSPTLILHGNTGWEESLLLSHDQAGLQYLPTGSRIVIFDGVEHSLGAYLKPAGALAVQWFEEFFPLHRAAS